MQFDNLLDVFWNVIFPNILPRSIKYFLQLFTTGATKYINAYF